MPVDLTNNSISAIKDASINSVGDSITNEIYHSMQGYMKPRIMKYSLQITQVSCGDSHLTFITTCGHLYTMGSNEKGKLGLGDTDLTQVAVPSLVPTLSEKEVIAVSCGKSHTAAILRSGKVYTWGEYQYGALGVD